MNTIRGPLIIKFGTFTISSTLNTVPESRFFLKEGFVLVHNRSMDASILCSYNVPYVTVIGGFYKTRMTKNPFVRKQIWLSDRRKQRYKYPPSSSNTHTHKHTHTHTHTNTHTHKHTHTHKNTHSHTQNTHTHKNTHVTRTISTGTQVR